MLEAKDQEHRRKCSSKKRFPKIFFRLSKKKVLKKFSGEFQKFNKSKILLSSSQGQSNFRGLEASRPRTRPSRPRTSKCVLKAKDVLEDSTSGNYLSFAGDVFIHFKHGESDWIKSGIGNVLRLKSHSNQYAIN